MKKSIAILLYSNMGSGGLKVLYRVANGLVEKGYDVTLYIAESKDFVTSQYYCQAKVVFAPYKIPLRLFPRLKYLMSLKIKADIVLATYFPTAIAAKFNRNIKGTKYYYVQAYEPHFFNFRAITFIRRFHYYLLSKLSYQVKLNMVVNCQGSVKGPGKDNYLAMIAPGIDLDVYHPRDKTSERKLRIGHISRIERRKGSKEFFDAMQILKEEGIDIEVVVAYNQWKNTPFHDYEIVMPSDEKELALFYSSCHVVVSTVWEKGFAYPPLETMACGAISLSTPIDYGNPWTDHVPIQVNNAQSIVDAVKWVIQNPEQAQAIQRNGMEFSKKYSWKNIINQWDELFENNSTNQ